MAHSLTEGERLRRAGEALIDVADRWDSPTYSLLKRQCMHDEVETAVADAREIVRGPARR